jgi:hypothetical protein
MSRSVQSFHREAVDTGERKLDTDTIIEIVQFNSAYSVTTVRVWRDARPSSKR